MLQATTIQLIPAGMETGRLSRGPWQRGSGSAIEFASRLCYLNRSRRRHAPATSPRPPRALAPVAHLRNVYSDYAAAWIDQSGRSRVRIRKPGERLRKERTMIVNHPLFAVMTVAVAAPLLDDHLKPTEF